MLQRRNYASLLSQVENEAAIQSVNSMSEPTSRGLKTIEAETVLFGSVDKDFSGSIRLQVSFQALNNQQILLQNSIFLSAEDAQDMFKRKEKVRQFIKACVNPEAFNEERDWKEAGQIGTREAFLSYLEKYPSGLYTSIARRAVSDETAWSEILNETRDRQQIKLLEDYRDAQFNRHENEANALLEDLLFRKGNYGKYLTLFPDGRYAEQAQKNMEENRQRTSEAATQIGGILSDVLIDGQKTSELPGQTSENSKNTTSYGGLQSGTYTIQQKSTGRYVDAYETVKDYALVTRSWQNDGSQHWILTPLGNNTYSIQQKKTSRYVDAYENSNNYGLVTRPVQNNSSQQWVLTPLGNNTYTIQQKKTGRYVDAYENSDDYALVTRPWQNNSSQQWIIKQL